MFYENEGIDDLLKIYLECKAQFGNLLKSFKFEELHDRLLEIIEKKQNYALKDHVVPIYHKEMVKEVIIEIYSEILTDLLLFNQFFLKESFQSLLDYIGLNNFVKIKEDMTESSPFYRIYKNFSYTLKDKFIFNPNSKKVTELKNEDESIDAKRRLTPDIFSKLAELLQYSKKKINQPDGGTFFTPDNEITLICKQALIYRFIQDIKQKKPNIVKELLGLMNGNKINEKFTLNKLLINDILKNISILDPACGTGKFLLIMADILYNLEKSVRSGSKEQCHSILSNVYSKLRGIEVNPTIAFKARLLLFLHFYQTIKIETGTNENIDYNINPTHAINYKILNSIISIGDFLWNDNYRSNSENLKFQIIVGNPPFVRQENIKPIGISLINLLLNYDSDINANYKNRIVSQINNLFINKIGKLQYNLFNKRSDLYIYFFYNAFSFLDNNGIIAYVSSNSWLNVGFGFDFQRYLLTQKRILSIVGNCNRTFGSAKINTITSFFTNTIHDIDPIISFINLKKLASQEDIDIVIPQIFNWEFIEENPSKISEYNSEHLQIRSINLNHLIYLGSVSSSYIGCRWDNLFLLGPSFYFKILPLIGDKLLRLGDISQITRGITTGINKFFIVKKVKEDFQRGVISVTNGFGFKCDVERKFLRPIITSPKNIHKPIIKEEEIKEFLFYINNHKENLKNTLAEKYITYGESLRIPLPKGKNKSKIIIGMQNIPSLVNKDKWYATKVSPNLEDCDFFIQKIFDRTYKWCSIRSKEGNSKILALNNFYCLKLKKEYKDFIKIIDLSLFSSLMIISIELNARRTFGSGALDTASFDIENILVINPFKLSDLELASLLELYDKIINLGFISYKEILKNNDLVLLDELIFRFLKLIQTKHDLDLIYNSLLDIISIRLDKVKSFK